MRLNYIHQEITAKTVIIKYIDTDNQVADVLITKPLAAQQFVKLSDKLLSGFGNKPIEAKRKTNKPVTNNQID